MTKYKLILLVLSVVSLAIFIACTSDTETVTEEASTQT